METPYCLTTSAEMLSRMNRLARSRSGYSLAVEIRASRHRDRSRPPCHRPKLASRNLNVDLRRHERRIFMMGARHDREGGLRPLLKQFVVEPNRLGYRNAGVGIAV